MTLILINVGFGTLLSMLVRNQISYMELWLVLMVISPSGIGYFDTNQKMS